MLKANTKALLDVKIQLKKKKSSC